MVRIAVKALHNLLPGRPKYATERPCGLFERCWTIVLRTPAVQLVTGPGLEVPQVLLLRIRPDYLFRPAQ